MENLQETEILFSITPTADRNHVQSNQKISNGQKKCLKDIRTNRKIQHKPYFQGKNSTFSPYQEPNSKDDPGNLVYNRDMILSIYNRVD